MSTLARPSNLVAGFAKLQGEDFEYFMQQYSIILGRNSKKASVDLDLAGIGGGMNISRQHARVYFDFDQQQFLLEVLGKNGAVVGDTLHLPGGEPVKLTSQDLLQIGDKRFYFLLPAHSPASQSVAAAAEAVPHVGGISKKRTNVGDVNGNLKSIKRSKVPSTQQSEKEKWIAEASKGGRVAKGVAKALSARSELDGEKQHDVGVHDDSNDHAEAGDVRDEDMSNAEDPSGPSLEVQALEEQLLGQATDILLSERGNGGAPMLIASLNSELRETFPAVYKQAKELEILLEDAGKERGHPLAKFLQRYPDYFKLEASQEGSSVLDLVSLIDM